MDFQKLADMVGYPSAEAMRRQWQVMQGILAEITDKVKVADSITVKTKDDDTANADAKEDPDAASVAPIPNDDALKTIPKEMEIHKYEEPENKSDSAVGTPKIFEIEPSIDPLLEPELDEPAPPQFDENLQRMWDDGLMDGGFGPNTVFGSVPVPPAPPAGYGFGMGTYNNFDDDEDPTFISYESYESRTTSRRAHGNPRADNRQYRYSPYPGRPNRS
ncbi:hypothetical protein F5Y08DRAFT_339320 [Xylaria arbuscula]|nr:hypothetical protein F5Y08DRAFT_339320 [Xylaria arbuscula]